MPTNPLWLKPELIWFMLAFVLLLFEFASPGFVIFFFGVGALLTSLICLAFKISLNLQLGIFLISSIALLALLRSRLRGVFKGRTDQNGQADELVGQKAQSISELKPGLTGQVSFHGSTWQAQATEEIAAGQTVEITGLEGLTLIVKPLH